MLYLLFDVCVNSIRRFQLVIKEPVHESSLSDMLVALSDFSHLTIQKSYLCVEQCCIAPANTCNLEWKISFILFQHFVVVVVWELQN